MTDTVISQCACDVTVVFLDPDFPYETGIPAIREHYRQKIKVFFEGGGAMRYIALFIVGSHTFKCSLDHAKRSFCRAVNEIFGRLKCGPMPNVMVALPNIGAAVCSTPQSFADAHCWSTVQ